MPTFELGQGVNLEHYVRDRDGALANADVVLTVTRPAGTTITPSLTNPTTGRYRAATFVPDAVGAWTFRWDVTGAVSDVADGAFTVIPVGVVPLGGPYATLSQLKFQMGIADNNSAKDADLTRRLASASNDINNWCHRQFGRSDTATTRRFRAGVSGVDVHDFWTQDDLAIVPWVAGVAQTAWDVDSLDIEPLDGIVNETPGWPYRRIVSTWGDHPLWRAINWSSWTIRVTAKWGWESVPDNVVTACVMLAAADEKAKDAPFGVAGFGDYAVRIRQNPMVEEKLRDYVIDPVKVAA